MRNPCKGDRPVANLYLPKAAGGLRYAEPPFRDFS